jgi:adenosine deaminase
LAWELDIADLKKLSLNGIKYSAVSDEIKKKLTEEVFPTKWQKWVSDLAELKVE